MNNNIKLFDKDIRELRASIEDLKDDLNRYRKMVDFYQKKNDELTIEIATLYKPTSNNAQTFSHLKVHHS